MVCRKAWYPVDLTPTKESDDNIGKIPSPETLSMQPTTTPSSGISHLTSEALRSHDAKQTSTRRLIGQSSLEPNNGASQSTAISSSIKQFGPQNAKLRGDIVTNRQM